MFSESSVSQFIERGEAKRARPVRLNAREQLHALGYEVKGYEPASLRVERYRDDTHRSLWEKFVSASANGNLFQSRRFLDYHPQGRFEDHSLLFWREQKLIAVAAGESTKELWSSHRFTSHAGIAVRPQVSASEALDVVNALMEYSRAQGWHRLSMRYVPDLLAEHSFTTLTWALAIFGFREDSREMTWCVLPRFSSETELLGAYHVSARRSIGRAEKESLLVKQSDDCAIFWQLLTRNLEWRFQVAPTHSLAEIERLRALCPGEVRLHAVHQPDGRMIAGALVFDVSHQASHCFYFAQDYQFQNYRPMALLMHRLNVEYGIMRGRKLNYGVITAAGAHELNLGLSRFKSQFSTVPSIRRRFFCELQP